MASSASAGGDLGSGAPAPGPMAGEPPADVLFTLMSTGATLAADKLTLTGVSDVALYSSSSRQTGVYQTGAQPGLRWECAALCGVPPVTSAAVNVPVTSERDLLSIIVIAHQVVGAADVWLCLRLRVAAFTNTTTSSMFVARNGRWLSDPVVVLRAANSTSALLQLANPVFDAAAKTVTFQVCADACCGLPVLRSTCVQKPSCAISVLLYSHLLVVVVQRLCLCCMC